MDDQECGGSRVELLRRQMRAVAQLGREATGSNSLSSLLQRAAELVALAQPVELCEVLQLTPDRTKLLLVAGVGWAHGLAGAAQVDNDAGSQAGFTLLERETVLVDDLSLERRFDAPALLQDHGVCSGMSMAIMVSGSPWGVLGAHARAVRHFTQDDAQFLQSVAQILAATIERLAVQQGLRISEERFRRTFDDAAAGIAISSLDYRFLDANAAYCALVGYSLDELRQRDATALTLPDDIAEMGHLTQQLLDGERSSYIVERCNRTRSGRLIWLRRSVSVKRDLQGTPVGLIAVVQDISQQKAAEEALSRSQLLLGVASRIGRLGAWQIALPAGTASWSDEMCRIHGMPPGYAPTLQNAFSFYRPEQVGAIRAALDACALQGTGFDMEVELVPHSGASLWVHAIGEAERGPDGVIVCIRGAVQDISQRKRTEQHVFESEERFRLLAEITQDMVWDWNLTTNRIWWSEGRQSLFGTPGGDDQREEGRDWAAGGVSRRWLARVHPDDRAHIQASLGFVMAGATDRFQHGYRFQRADGSYLAVVDRGFVVRDAQGQPQRMIGGVRDVTEQRSLEAQLRQSQRLESVGQLTGGMAHDFNNLLTVIMGNAELLANELPADRGQQDLARMILDAAQRGADLTQRMLAFARRQPLEPRVVDINQLMAGMDAMLRRTLGEQIEIGFMRGAGLWQALVDPAQLESALLNLCLNARDAMPEGGRLTVETNNTDIEQDDAQRHVDLAPGQYVMVAVSDTGVGIAPEYVGRVVEPFFTTKEKGRGTGLGLSMVYGFVKQSRGHVSIYSELGQGTTVKMYLPRAQAQVQLAPPQAQALAQMPVDGGTDTVLLVEDDELVRRYAASQLVSLGYAVIEAADGPGALRILAQDAAQVIDLLFTDVVMPGGMNGRQLADAARRLRPDLSVLFTSGYTENALVHHGRLDAGVLLLGKPYRRAELARRVRDALHGESSGTVEPTVSSRQYLPVPVPGPWAHDVFAPPSAESFS